MKKELVFLLMVLSLGGYLQGAIQSKPDNKVDPKETFAFTSRGDYIYLYNWTTKKLKNTGVKGYDPCLSPDGKKVAFVIKEDYTGGIYIANIDGSEKQKLTKDSSYPGVMGSPQWSPDGKEIFFWANSHLITKEGIRGIYRMNVDDGTTELLVKEGDEFDLSPDGKKIVFEGERGGLWIMNIDGTDCKMISNNKNTTASGGIIWSPDGKKIAFADSWNLYTIDPDGTNFKQLRVQEGRVRIMLISVTGWTPDNKIIYLETDEAPFISYYFWTINFDGTGKEKLMRW